MDEQTARAGVRTGAPTASTTDLAHVRHAIDLARRGLVVDPNPRVGAVIVAPGAPPGHRSSPGPEGTVVGVGWHAGAGTPHAEVVALAEAGDRARGATAYVSLEPCRHTGRTGPCTQALIEAGIRRVVYAQPDPDPVAGGGAEVLRAAGVAVTAVTEIGPVSKSTVFRGAGSADVTAEIIAEATALNDAWSFAVRHGRPRVLWKTATTLDGRSAAADGTSRWITGSEARAAVHRLRAACGAVLVGTGTVLADDPRLTVRAADGREVGPQPLRVVLGERDLPADSVLGAAARQAEPAAPGESAAPAVLHLRHRHPDQALTTLHELGIRHVLLEGGPTLAAAFLRAGLIDRVVIHLAPMFLGAGLSLGDFGVPTLAAARRLRIRHIERLGPDLAVTADVLGPRREPASPSPTDPTNTPSDSPSEGE